MRKKTFSFRLSKKAEKVLKTLPRGKKSATIEQLILKNLKKAA